MLSNIIIFNASTLKNENDRVGPVPKVALGQFYSQVKTTI